MSLLDQLYAEDNDSNLNIILGISPSSHESSNLLLTHSDIVQEKQISVTYNWIWQDEEPIESESLEQVDDKAVD